MKNILFYVALAIVLCSCEAGNWPIHVTMEDGKTITISPKTRYYTSEDEFIHGVSFPFPYSYIYPEIEKIDYVVDSSYTVTGYDQFFVGNWEIARFGEWARQYGLKPNSNYYVATKVYAKYVPKPPSELNIKPKLDIALMGYVPWSEYKTFFVSYEKDAQVSVLTTGVRYIGYDSERKNIDLDMPSFNENKNNKLTWKFLIVESVWG